MENLYRDIAFCRHDIRSPFRRHFKYHRMWERFCLIHELAIQNLDTEVITAPRLKKITTGRHIDHLLIRMLPGQTPNMWGAQELAIMHSLGCYSVHTSTQSSGKLLMIIELYKLDSTIHWDNETSAHVEYH